MSQENKPAIPDVGYMIQQFLRENGYDGLCNEEGCGCLINDLAPCGHLNQSCQAGFKREFDPQEDPPEWKDSEFIIAADGAKR